MRMRNTLLRVLAVASFLLASGEFVFGQTQSVRWDIISLVFGTATTPNTFNPGGVASAKADNGSAITLTGAGTFLAPADRRGSFWRAATGGGKWQTFSPTGASSGSGSFVVTGLLRFELANLQTGPGIDNIGKLDERANGYALLEVDYDDGSRGILGIGCNGPGSPGGIIEGVIATKGFSTYWIPQSPVPLVDANRTIFHVHK